MIKPRQRTVKLAFIGCGDMAVTHMKDLVNLDNRFEVVALNDISEKRMDSLIEKFHIKAEKFTDYNELLSLSEIEAVIICSPNHLHHEHACATLNAGKHLLLQKPMALTIDDCDEIIHTAQTHSKVLQVGLVYRYSTLFREMNNIIQSGAIGKPVMAWCHEFRVPFPVGRGREWRYDEKYSGGSLVEKNCHHFDLFQWFFNAVPTRVYATGDQQAVKLDGDMQPGVPGEGFQFDADSVNNIIDNAWVNIEFSDGKIANLGLSLFANNRDLPIGVIGSKGWIEVNVQQKKLFLNRGQQGYTEIIEPEKKSHELADAGHSGGARELLEFYNCICYNEKPFCDGKIGRDSLLAALAAEKSIKERRIVEIDELLNKPVVVEELINT
jgi:predicted dehydrogenase